MAGQIIKRGDDSFLVRIFLGRDGTGKRRYHNKTIHGTKKDAQRYLTAALRRLDLGEALSQSVELCADFFDKWLTTAVKPRIRERSYELYQATVNRYILPTLGSRRLADVKPLDIQHLYAKLLADGLTANTINSIHARLHNAFDQAVRWELIRQNPVALVSPPRMTKPEMKALDREQAKAFLTAARENARYFPAFFFALSTGCRPEEYFAVKWSDIDWQTGTITIQRALWWRKKKQGWVFTEPKTKAARRTIPLGKALMDVLKDWKRSQAEERLKAGSEWQNHDLVFTKRTGRPLDLCTTSEAFKAALKSAELPKDFRLYDLRHTCASLLMAEGLNPKIVSERLGHANISITLGIYSHVAKGMQEEASERLEKVIFG